MSIFSDCRATNWPDYRGRAGHAGEVRRTTYRTVTRSDPCPVCAGDHKCSVGEDASVQCGRVPDGLARGQEHNGYVFMGLSLKDPQFGTFRPADDPELARRKRERQDEWDRHRHRRNGTADHHDGPDMGAIARARAAALTPGHAAELAKSLGLRADILARLPLLGYSPSGFHADRKGQACWTFPEVDAAGKIVGVLCRYGDGHKPRVAGGHMGVIVPERWDAGEGPVYLVEGPSDTLALLALNLTVLGRPSNAGGAEHLAGLLKGLAPDRDIVVVGEYDANDKGQWPGLDGAKGTAARLAELLKRPVCWALPPNGAKDVRAWAVAQQLPPDCLDAWHEAGGRLGGWLAENARQKGHQASPDAPAAAVIREIDADELLATDAPDLEYLPLLGRPGYLVCGWSHLLAGYPRCGKTELMVACIREWLGYGQRVLYLTEESETLWRQRLGRRPGPWGGLQLVFGLGVPPDRLLSRMAAADQSVVVVDTMRNLGVIGPDENDNAAIARAVMPWVSEARRTGKTWFGLHHNRKGGGDYGEGISGGHALMGCVDIALEVGRDRNKMRRRVKGNARLIDVPELLYEQDEGGGLRALGDPAGVTLMEVRARLLLLLGEQWMTRAQVMELLDEPRPGDELMRQALELEAKGGRVERDPPMAAGSTPGKTYRWRAAPTYCVQQGESHNY